MQGYDFRLFSVKSLHVSRRSARPLFLAAAVMGAGLFFTALQPAAAQDTVLGKFKDWTAHSYSEPDSKVCNIWSRPIDSKPANVRRGDIYAFVTHRPGVNSRSAVSFQMGYPLRPGEPVSLQIGNRKFNLTAEGEAAFAEAQDEPTITNAMRRGNRMVVRGTSTRGTRTTDTYSLSGVTAAHNAINTACPG